MDKPPVNQLIVSNFTDSVGLFSFTFLKFRVVFNLFENKDSLTIAQTLKLEAGYVFP